MTRIVVRNRIAPTTLFVALPHDPIGGDAVAHWWRVTGNGVEAGADGDWPTFAADPQGAPQVIGLAPAALVRLAFSTPAAGAAGRRQVETIARVGALEQSLGEPETLHAAIATLNDDPPTLVTAIAANSKMQEWLDWADGLGVRIDHIVPAAMVLPLDDEWTAVTIGTERIIGRRNLVLADELMLREALLSDGELPIEMETGGIHSALARLAAAPLPDLRTGRFARRRRLVINRLRLRELAFLTLAILLVSTLIAVIEIVKLNSSRSALDSETLAIARQAAGPSATLDNAEALLAARAGSKSFSSGVAAVLARVQPEPNVSLSALGYGGGTLTFTVSGQDSNSINRVLLALQRDGYRITAVPRTQSDGRTLADVTLREGP